MSDKVQIQEIVNEMKGEKEAFLSGETKKVRVKLAALTRVEYSEVVEVPVEFDESELDSVVNKAYDKIDGGDYWDDPDYWEKGNCYSEPET